MLSLKCCSASNTITVSTECASGILQVSASISIFSCTSESLLLGYQLQFQITFYILPQPKRPWIYGPSINGYILSGSFGYGPYSFITSTTNFRVCLGMGKTSTALAFLSLCTLNSPVLVAAPLCVLHQWKEEEKQMWADWQDMARVEVWDFSDNEKGTKQKKLNNDKRMRQLH